MPIISRVVSIGLRFAELVCAAVVAGVIGKYLNDSESDSWSNARFIYTEVLAALSIILSLVWMLPFAGGFIHYPIDLLISGAWFASFGLLVQSYHHFGCGSIWQWHGMIHGGFCNRMKAGEAFSFLSAIFWLVSTIVGAWFVHRTRRDYRHESTYTTRRRWYRSSHV